MANPNKQRGTAWESAVRDYLNVQLGLYHDDWRDRARSGLTPFRNPADSLNVKRQAQEGVFDVGDLHASPFIIECKDVASPSVPKWLGQAEREARNAGFPYGVAVHKRRGLNVSQGSVHISRGTWHRMCVRFTCDPLWFMDAYAFTQHCRGSDSSRHYYTTTLEHFARLLSDFRQEESATR